MTDRTKKIVAKFASRDTAQLKAAIGEVKGLDGLDAAEKQELASGLLPLFYRESANKEPLEDIINEAEEALASLGGDVTGVLLMHLVEADAESMEHFAKALGMVGGPAVDPVLESLEAHKGDQYATSVILQAMGNFSGQDAMKLLPRIFEHCGSDDARIRAAALSALGKFSQNVDYASMSEDERAKMFEACFTALSSPKPLSRLHAVRAIGTMLQNSYLNSEQVDRTHKAFRAILGMDDFDWDDAYIVRYEAERFLHLCRGENATPAGPVGDRYHHEFKILSKRELSPNTYHLRIHAPLLARKIQAGQFIIIRPNSHSERIPLSICGWDRDEGYIEIIIMGCGRTSTEAIAKEVGDSFTDVVGPLGQRSHVAKHDGACVVMGGGYGTGAIIPTARDLRAAGNKVYGIVGARSKDLLIMVDELREACDEVFVTTNDGSDGIEGFVTHALEKIMEREKVSYTLSVGPVPMMMAVTNMTRGKDIESWVSLNAIMVDGTGMCGACRVSVGGQTKFACFHGPDFLGADVDFDELTKRQRMFVDKEKIAMEALNK